MDILNHPVMPTLLMCILSLWPLMRLYRRVGVPGACTFLVFVSLIVPFSGFVLAFLPLAITPWPKFPKTPAPEKPVKVAI